MRDYEECRPYIDHLTAEHRRLHALLGTLRGALARCEGTDGKCVLAIADGLAGLRQELSQHFTEEELGGCLDEAVSRCPRLSGEEKRIEAEHPQILARIDRMIEELRSGQTTEAERLALQNELHELSECLLRHEEAENRLLEESFGESVNGYEPGQYTAASGGCCDRD